jgi:hypothetical protein
MARAALGVLLDDPPCLIELFLKQTGKKMHLILSVIYRIQYSIKFYSNSSLFWLHVS